MSTIQRTLTLRAPAETVWAIVADPKRAPAWMPDITDRDVSAGDPLGVGVQWREQGLLRGRTYTTMYEVTAWEPPHRIAYRRLAAAKGDYHWVETITLQPGAGETTITLSLDYAMPGGIIGKLYEHFLFRKDFSSTLDNRLERLQELCERAILPAPASKTEAEAPRLRRVRRAGSRKDA